MAGLDDGKLSNKQYTQLAEAISGPNMETIAQGYLDIDPDFIASIKQQHLNRATQSNMDLLRRWANKNDGPQQRKVRKNLLFRSKGTVKNWLGRTSPLVIFLDPLLKYFI